MVQRRNRASRLNSSQLTTKKGVLLAAAASAALSLYSLSAEASTWVGDTSQDWNTAANWDSDPNNPTGNFTINSAVPGIYPILNANSAFTPVDVFIGNGPGTSGQLDHSSGTMALQNSGVNGNWMFVGVNDGVGTYNLTGNASLAVGKLWLGGFVYGERGTGVVNVDTTGALNANSTDDFTTWGQYQTSLSIGWGTYPSGAANATLNLINGTINTPNRAIFVGAWGSNGTLNQSGGTINTNGLEIVRWFGTGTANVSGGTMNTAFVNMGRTGNNGDTANAVFNVSGTGVVNSAGDFVVAVGGSSSSGGTLNVSGSGVVNIGTTAERWMVVNQFDSISGTINVDGGTINLNANTDLRFSTGNASTAGPGVVNLNSGAINSWSGNQTGGSTSGVVDLNWIATAANNTFNLNGGTLMISQIITTNDGGTAIMNFNGGRLKAAGNSANFVDLGGASQRANVRNSGAVIDTNGYDVTVVQALRHSDVGGDNAIDGGLIKYGTGILTLGSSSDYTGATTINNGGLVLQGDLTATSGVTMAAGTSLGVKGGNRAIASGISLNSNSLSFEFNAGAVGALNLGGTASVSGANTINISLASGALSTGNYTLMTATSGLGSGFTLGTVPPGFYTYSLASSTATAEILSVVGNATPTGATYWTGLGSAGTADAANNWGSGSGINTSNWSTTADGLTDPKQVPGAVSDVIFTAANATGSPALSTKLDAAYSIGSLKFDVPASTGITSVGVDTNAQTLTIGATGLSVAATSNASASITGAGQVKLNGTQAWTNDSALAMTVGTPVSAASGATTLTIGGSGGGTISLGGAITDGGGAVTLIVNKAAGTVNLSGTGSSYSGATTIQAGTVNVSGSIASTSAMTILGGTVNVSGAISSSGALNVGGEGGTGVMNIATGANVNFPGLSSVGYRTGNGTLNMTGGTLTVGGDFRVGGSDLNGAAYNSTGVVNISGGAANLNSLAIARGNFLDNSVSGTMTVSGGVVNSANDVILGFAGTGTARLGISAGSFNVGTTAARWMVMGTWDSTNSEVVVSGGSLNLNYGSSLVFATQGNTGSHTFTQSGGAITSFTGYANDGTSTVGGGAGLNMQQAGSSGFRSTYNLDGGTLTVFRIFSANTTGTRVFNFNGGTLRPTQSDEWLLNLGAGSATANVRNGGAKIDTNGFNVTIPQGLKHSNIGGDNAIDGGLVKQGAGALALTGVNTYTGPTVIQGGTLSVSNTYTGFNVGGGAITIADGAALSTTHVLPGSSLQASALTVGSTTGGILNLGLNGHPGAAMISLTGDLARFGSSTINLSGGGLPAGSGSVTLISSATESGTGAFALGTLPNRVSGTLTDTGTGLVFLSYTATVPRWTGLGDGSWVAATQTPKNWKEFNGVTSGADTDYVNGDSVLFDDSATGTTTVNIPSAVTPASVTVNNSALTYTFSGLGKISGASGLIKSGNGRLIINTPAGNDYSGGTTINAGTIEIQGTSDTTANLNFLGTGPIVNNGVIHFNRPSGGGNLRHDYTLLRPSVSGNGSLVIQSNVATDGSHSFNGTVTVMSGALYFIDNAGAFGSTVGATTVENGAGLQVFGASRNYGLENITMSGTGPTYDSGTTYMGAIFVEAGRTATFGGTMTLAGDTSFRSDGTLLFSGNIAGSGNALAQFGTGRVVINGPATYGVTNASNGIIQIGAGTTTGNIGSGDVNLTTGTVAFNHSDNLTVTNKFSGGGTIINIGAGSVDLTSNLTDATGNVVAGDSATGSVLLGTTILSGSGNFATLTVNNGVLRLKNSAALGSLINVNIAANNAGVGRLEISNNLTDALPDVGTNFSGRAGLTPGLQSINGNNSTQTLYTLQTGGNNYTMQVDAGSTLEIKNAPSYGQALIVPVATTGARNLILGGAGAGTISGVITVADTGVSSLSVSKTGSGTWTLSAANGYNGNTISNAGTLVLKDGANDVVETGALGGITNGGAIVLDYNDDGNTGSWGSEIVTNLEGNANTGFLVGRIRTTAAVDATKAIGWLDDTTAKTFKTRYTYKGDINLSGVVESTDFAMLAAGYGKFEPTVATVIWKDGDVNYDGKVNTIDFNYLAGNFGLAAFGGAELGAELGATPGAALGAVVPEPATLGVLGMGLMGLLARRRR